MQQAFLLINWINCHGGEGEKKKYEKKYIFELRTYWWVQNPRGIMQLTQAHGSVLLQQPEPVKGNYPGERGRGSRSCRSREGRQARGCHGQLPAMLYLCQDTPDQRTIKPFHQGWLQKPNAKWQQLGQGDFSAAGRGTPGLPALLQPCPVPFLSPLLSPRTHGSFHTQGHPTPPPTVGLRHSIWFGRKPGRGEGGEAANADTSWR